MAEIAVNSTCVDNRAIKIGSVLEQGKFNSTEKDDLPIPVFQLVFFPAIRADSFDIRAK